MVTRAQLQKLAPGARKDIVDAIINNWQYAVMVGGLTTPARVRPFFANICAECGGMTILEEDMRYTADRMMAVWPDRFPTYKSAAPFVGNPQGLAVHVYGGRMGNAPAPSMDGWIYRGGGLLQATGKDEYVKVGYGDNPDVLRTDPVAAFKSAVQLWASMGLNALADANQVTNIRKRINGGNNGMDVMRHFLAIAKEVWPDGMDLSEPSHLDIAENQETVKEAQTKLIALGYTEVGKADGEVGTYTQVAIDAFRKDNGLPAGGVDDQLLDALDHAQPRKTARSEAPPTKAEVRSAVPEVLAAFYTRVIAFIAALVSFISTLFDAIVNNFSDAESKISPLRSYFDTVPGWAWCGLIMIVAVTIYMLANSGEQSGVKAYQNGERR